MVIRNHCNPLRHAALHVIYVSATQKLNGQTRELVVKSVMINGGKLRIHLVVLIRQIRNDTQ